MPPGIISSWLLSLKPGDKVEASGPFGDFHVQPTEREMIFIVGGVGMAPLRAVIHEQLGAGSGHKMHYFYGARSHIIDPHRAHPVERNIASVSALARNAMEAVGWATALAAAGDAGPQIARAHDLAALFLFNTSGGLHPQITGDFDRHMI